MNSAKRDSAEILRSARSFGKWIFISNCTGVLGGLIGSAFHLSVHHAETARLAHPWFLYLLPFIGLVIVGLYKLTRMERENTNAIIDSIHFGEKVPVRLLPSIFLSTALTHLCGGSAGREGAALQIGGSIGFTVGRIFHLDEKDKRIATLSGMSAVFAALFGTPMTATFFALEVISVGVVYYSGLIPCFVASLIAYKIAMAFGIAPTAFALSSAPIGLGLVMFLKVGLLALLCCIVSVIFCQLLHKTEHVFSHRIPNPFLRIFIGGCIIIVMTQLVGVRDYNGAGMDIITRAIETGVTRPGAFFWKMLFTAVTIGCGFKGGEVVPTFFVGATFGCFAGSLLGIDPCWSAAIGLICVFCGAVNCPVASLLLSIELFGSAEIIYFALATGISFTLSGYVGLYSSQKIVYSKLKAEFINIYAK